MIILHPNKINRNLVYYQSYDELNSGYILTASYDELISIFGSPKINIISGSEKFLELSFIGYLEKSQFSD